MRVRFEPRSSPGRVIDVKRRSRRGRRIATAAALLIGLAAAGMALSWYVETLWFESLGLLSVFWTTMAAKAIALVGVAGITTLVVGGGLSALRPKPSAGRTIFVNGQPVTLSFGPLVTTVIWTVAALAGLVAGSGAMDRWTVFLLFWHQPAAIAGAAPFTDPIFKRPETFYLFTLPFWHLIGTWATTVAALLALGSAIMLVLAEGEQVLFVRRVPASGVRPFGPLSLAIAVLLTAVAWQVYLARFDRLLVDHTLFAGATYTDAHVIIPGLLWVMAACGIGVVIAAINAFSIRRLAGIVLAVLLPVVAWGGMRVAAWYVSGFVVKPNELVRETPFIRHNIAFTLRAFGLDDVDDQAFPAEPGVDALDRASNQTTLENIRLWDWRPLQETLRQIQEIRTYYDFPDLDVDRYRIGGTVRQMMVAARELSLDKLPESSRTWINERLIYTHGYGVTMNPVNGFTPDGLPELVMADMPVRSTLAGLEVTRPEIYFGQLTRSDVYVRTRQKEFNYPQGESNSYTTYEGKGGFRVGSGLRRLLVAATRGDATKLPFSDDVTADSVLLMRRAIHDRVRAVAPFLLLDPDPYVVVRRNGRLSWLLDAYTTANTYPYARAYRLGGSSINYIRNSVKIVIDAYDGTVACYDFDAADPMLAAYRRAFPELFHDADEMPADLREHVRYPELLLAIQGTVYGLYHMQDPAVFYNREDLWTVANEVVTDESRTPVTRPMVPNYVLMQVPGEQTIEFVGILPFTPANRNNLIGWLGGRSDGAAYGRLSVFTFPKTRLVDGPLQVEARIDQNPQLSAQLTLWNQQGSRARRGSLLVIPVGRGLLYAEPIYLQAERSPMPQLRLVVLALQDRLAFGSTFDEALQRLFVGVREEAAGSQPVGPPAGPAGAGADRIERDMMVGTEPADKLIEQAVRALAEYQRLTAEGRLGEAGQRLEDLRRILDELARERRKRK